MKTAFNNRYLYIITLVLVPVFFPHSAESQEKGLIQSKYYSTQDYSAGTQNWAITQDHRGVFYFGNVSGILEFDGENWRRISVKNQSTVRSLVTDKNGVIYVGAYGELGYLQPDETGEIQYNTLNALIDEKHSTFGEIWDINCFSDTIFFLSDKFLFRFLNGKFDYWESASERFYLSHKVKNTYYVQEMGKGLMKFSNNSLQLVEKGDYFSNIRIHTIFPTENGLLICSRTQGLFQYIRTGGRVTIKPFSELSLKARRLNDYFIENSFYHGIELNGSLYAMGSISGEILIVDKGWNVVDVIGHEIVGIKSPTHFLYYQKNHALWLALANGISQVEVMSPLRYWSEDMGITGVITDVARLGDYFYVSTGSGIFYTNNSECTSFELNKFSPVEGKFEQAWGFIYFQIPEIKATNRRPSSSSKSGSNSERNEILLAATSNGLFKIEGSKSTKISNYTSLMRLHQSKEDPSKLIIGLNTGVAELQYRNGSWIDLGMKYGIEANIRDIAEDTLGNLWLSASYKGLYRIKSAFSKKFDSTSIEIFDSTHGLASINSIRILEEKKKLYFLSGNNYYKFVEKENRFVVHDFSEDTTSTDNETDNFVDSLSWNRVWDDIISSFYVAHPEDTVVWFSTNSGTFKHNHRVHINYLDLNPTVIRKVVVGDSVLFNGTNSKPSKTTNEGETPRLMVDPNPLVDLGIVLKYENNSLVFSYSWPYYQGEKQNEYSYYLVGYDHGWSEWRTEKKKEYTNLHEGNYSFKVKAKNIYGVESVPAVFKFTILPPWYRTYYAYSGYLIIFILLVIAIVRFYTYRLIKEKEKLEGIVKERTQEILMQNEEILVQAEHLKDANEWISAKNVELETQKLEIVRKKDQLEVSNATKNKFFRIIAHDLRNPISTLVNSTGYMLTDYDELDKTKTKRFIEDLNRLSLTTYNLLENLLDWSTSQMGELKYNPQQLDLVSVVNENIELTKGKIESKSIDLIISLPETLVVRADVNMIHTVVRNLISNAVKFTRENGTIKIFSSENDTSCSLSIDDNGVGISKENIEKLFRIDMHLSTPGTHNEKGSGLGLILCKEFIECNGGSISVESEFQKGSTFTITLKKR